METTIRLATPDDGGAFAEIYAPYVRETYISFEEEAPSPESMMEKVRETLLTLPWLSLVDEGRVVGYAYASVHRDRPGYRWAVDTAIYLSPEFQGRGGGRALYTALIPMLQAQGYVWACAGIALPNKGSVGLHEAMGFRQIALYPEVGFKQGGWHDVGWWVRVLNARSVPPAEATPFPMLDRAALKRALSLGMAQLRSHAGNR